MCNGFQPAIVQYWKESELLFLIDKDLKDLNKNKEIISNRWRLYIVFPYTEG